MPFGVYRGETMRDIYFYNPIYVQWLILNVDSFCINVGEFEKIGLIKPISRNLFPRIPVESEKRMSKSQWTRFTLAFVGNTNPKIEYAKEYEKLGFNIPELDFHLPESVVLKNNSKQSHSDSHGNFIPEDLADDPDSYRPND